MQLSKIKLKKNLPTVLGITAGLLLLGASLFFFFGTDSGYTVTTYSMGSYVQQTLYGKSEEKAARSAAGAIAELENLLSWRREESDVQKLNLQAGKEFVSLQPATISVLETALSVCEKSGGAFDITIAPLSLLWDFDGTPTVPAEKLIKDLLPRVDYTVLSLQPDGTAALKKAGAALDLGAVGKGAACDEAVRVYAEEGLDRGIIAVGGSVGLYGEKPFGQPWHIAVRNPAGSGSLGELTLKSGFVSTSGSYEKTFTENGKTYHHLLNPDTGYPAEGELVSVTVVSQGGALSDALSTACFVLGMEKSLPLLQEYRAQALFITSKNEIFATDGLKEAFSLSSKEYILREMP